MGGRMNEEQKMFKIGVGALICCFCVMVGLQVCYRIQHRTLNYTNSEIRKIQQQYAIEQAKFESMTNAEYLQDSIRAVVPKVEIIGFKKYTSVQDLPLRK